MGDRVVNGFWQLREEKHSGSWRRDIVRGLMGVMKLGVNASGKFPCLNLCTNTDLSSVMRSSSFRIPRDWKIGSV